MRSAPQPDHCSRATDHGARAEALLTADQRRPTALVRLAAGLVLSLGALTGAVLVADGVPGDQELLTRVSPAQALDPAARSVDRSTGYLPVTVVTTVLVLVLASRGRPRDGVRVAVSLGVTIAGTTVLKQLVARPRPEVLSPLADVSTFSYPSGHLAATTALAGAVVMTTRGSRWHRLAVAVAALLVVVAAAAQLVLGRHFPSDLLAGSLWSAACTAAVWSSGRGRAASGHP